MITDSISYSALSQIRTVELEPGKVVFGVVIGLDIFGSSSCGHSELSVPAELSDFVDSADIFASFISVVAEDDSFSDRSFDQLIQKQ